MTTATACGPEDFFDMDEDKDLGDGGLGSGNWLEPYRRHQEKGGGYSENDMNPSLEEREEAAEMEER